MKTLLLLRHAKSDWDNPDLADHDRPLNDRGRAAADRMARYLATESLRPDLILCSTATRTKQTLEPLLTGWSNPPPVRHEKAIYLASARSLLKLIRDCDPAHDSLMLIGHNPGLQTLSAELAGQGPDALLADMSEKFPTGTLAVLTFPGDAWSAVAPRRGRLLRYIKPRSLEDPA